VTALKNGFLQVYNCSLFREFGTLQFKREVLLGHVLTTKKLIPNEKKNAAV